jgi:hypothetical protein
MTNEDFTRIRDVLVARHQASTRLLTVRASGPVVFLMDENHSSVEVIRDNVSIAGTLIQDFGVVLIAVEGIEGDRLSWRDLKSSDPNRCFGVTHFGEQMVRNNKVEVVGVDSQKLFKVIETDCEKGGSPPAKHPAQAQRSAHMLDSLLHKLIVRPAVLAAILNGGTRHDDDIEQILSVKQDREISVDGASFIRIRSNFYPKP